MTRDELIENARKRIEIRRSIPRGEPDRIADLLEGLIKEIKSLEIKLHHHIEEGEALALENSLLRQLIERTLYGKVLS